MCFQYIRPFSKGHTVSAVRESNHKWIACRKQVIRRIGIDNPVTESGVGVLQEALRGFLLGESMFIELSNNIEGRNVNLQ